MIQKKNFSVYSKYNQYRTVGRVKVRQSNKSIIFFIKVDIFGYFTCLINSQAGVLICPRVVAAPNDKPSNTIWFDLQHYCWAGGTHKKKTLISSIYCLSCTYEYLTMRNLTKEEIFSTIIEVFPFTNELFEISYKEKQNLRLSNIWVILLFHQLINIFGIVINLFLDLRIVYWRVLIVN
jgi:hypothetical protein